MKSFRHLADSIQLLRHALLYSGVCIPALHGWHTLDLGPPTSRLGLGSTLASTRCDAIFPKFSFISAWS